MSLIKLRGFLLSYKKVIKHQAARITFNRAHAKKNTIVMPKS